jgi:hypothetical protein
MRNCEDWLQVCYVDGCLWGFTKVPQNGEKNTRFGVYKTICCGTEIVITEGTFFPDCPNHPQRTAHWNYVSEEVSGDSQARPATKDKRHDHAA